MAAVFKAKVSFIVTDLVGSQTFTQGNELFKAGNYAAAVGEYTSAMLADPKDPTFPLNRAAAYLKLSKSAFRDKPDTPVVNPIRLQIP